VFAGARAAQIAMRMHRRDASIRFRSWRGARNTRALLRYNF
jgi:hypothetical protein